MIADFLILAAALVLLAIGAFIFGATSWRSWEQWRR